VAARRVRQGYEALLASVYGAACAPWHARRALTVRCPTLADREPVLIFQDWRPYHITLRFDRFALCFGLGSVTGRVVKALVSKDDKRPESDERNSGQVKHDDRGNAVWHWASDTARTAMASTSQLLRKLDLSSLSLESDQQKQDDEPQIAPNKSLTAQPSTHQAAGPKGSPGLKRSVDTRKGGFDPYSSNAGSAKRSAPKPAPSVARTPTVSRQPAASEPRRSSWWQRLLRRD
jgi:hypothetical protein